MPFNKMKVSEKTSNGTVDEGGSYGRIMILGQQGSCFILVTLKWCYLKACVHKDLTKDISKTDSVYLKCSAAKKKHLSPLWTVNFLSSTPLCHLNLGKKAAHAIMIHKDSATHNCAQWGQNMKLLFSSMVFITLSSSAVYMIIYYLLFRGEEFHTKWMTSIAL